VPTGRGGHPRVPSANSHPGDLDAIIEALVLASRTEQLAGSGDAGSA